MIEPGALQFVGCFGAFLWLWLGLIGQALAGDDGLPNLNMGLLASAANACIAVVGFVWGAL